MDFWQWASASLPAGAIVNGLGLLSLAGLFAADRILTKGQHERRVADLEKGHAAVLAEKDLRYSEMKASRDHYRDARGVERDRADEVTNKLAELAEEHGKLVVQLLSSVQKAGPS